MRGFHVKELAYQSSSVEDDAPYALAGAPFVWRLNYLWIYLLFWFSSFCLHVRVNQICSTPAFMDFASPRSESAREDLLLYDTDGSLTNEAVHSQVTLPTQDELSDDSMLQSHFPMVEASSSTAGSAAPAKRRRRLRGKQRDPMVTASARGVGVEEHPALEYSPLSLQDGSGLNKKEYNLFYYRYNKWAKQQQERQGDSSDHLGHQSLKISKGSTKLKRLQEWAAKDTDSDLELRKRVLAHFQVGDNLASEGSASWRGNSILLTWNGDWGVFPLEAVGGDWLPEEEVCQKLSLPPAVLAIAKEISERLVKWRRPFHISDDGWSIELSLKRYNDAREACMESRRKYKEVDPLATPGRVEPSNHMSADVKDLLARPIRVHVHCFMRFQQRQRFNLSEAFLFKGTRPVQSTMADTRGTQTRRLSNAGMYYIQCPKKGMVMWGGASSPFRTYSVNGDWIINMLQLGKMTLTNVRKELLKTAKSLPRQFENLDCYQREQSSIELQARISETKAILAAKEKPCVEVPEVTQWKRSFDSVEHRYRFLVLDGPSKMGKTMFCRSLLPCRDCVFEVDCAGSEYPDLRSFDPLRHKLILFDEASAALVLRHKKLFQASASVVNLGSSPTNQHLYDVWVHRVMLVVASNRWAFELQDLRHEDANWLQANSVYVRVSRPLWVEEEESQAHEPPAMCFSQFSPVGAEPR